MANTTYSNRHPDLFTKSLEIIGDNTNRRILSYGCSTGEECFSLRRYFPNATIVGCDVNSNSLRKARAKNSDSKIQFIPNSELIEVEGFKMVFFLSVLCKEPESRVVKNLSKIFPFRIFNKNLIEIDAKLHIGGLLIIRNSNYRVIDSDVSTNYKCISNTYTSFPVFDKLGRRLEEPVEYCEIFKKIS